MYSRVTGSFRTAHKCLTLDDICQISRDKANEL